MLVLPLRTGSGRTGLRAVDCGNLSNMKRKPKSANQPGDLAVAAVQMESQAGDKAANFAKIESFVEQAVRRGVKLIVFPSAVLPGIVHPQPHPPPVWRNSPSQSLPAQAPAAHCAGQAKRYTIGAGLLRPASKAFINTVRGGLPDGRRHYIANPGIEHPLIKAGSKYTVFDIPGGFARGVLICLRQQCQRKRADDHAAGAEIILAPHQTGGCRTKNPHLWANEHKLWDKPAFQKPETIEREFTGAKGRVV